ESHIYDADVDAKHKNSVAGVVLYSTDGGGAWNNFGTGPAGTVTPSTTTGLPATAGYPVVSVLHRLDGTTPTLYASVWRQGVYKSPRDSTGAYGAWQQVGTLPANVHVYQLRTDSANNLYVDVVAKKIRDSITGRVVWNVDDTGIYKLNGTSWTKLSSN